MILKRVLSRIIWDRLSGDSLKLLSRISLGLDRLSGDSLKGAFKNQFGSGSIFG